MTTIPATAPAIAFLGTGRMGAPMAANLARRGFAVRVWNRTASRAAALAKDGAAIAGSPAEAVKGAGIVITMLADGPATEQAATGTDGFLPGVPGRIWVQMATIGMNWTARLADTAARRGATFVDAPVSGSQGPAQAGQLTILASGPDQVRNVLAPVFGTLGRATVWLGPAGHGTRAKLCGVLPRAGRARRAGRVRRGARRRADQHPPAITAPR
jgi:3-hydroxyisobutyrate dehydrogenase